MSNRLHKLMLAVALSAAAVQVQAAAGNGIRLGGSEGRLHPYVELEGRYDSNAYSVPVGLADFKSAADFILHVRPGAKLTVPGDMTSVELSANLDWAQYMGMDDPGSKDLSNLYAAASLGLGFNKRGVVSLEVEDTFRRSDRPQALTFAAGVISNYNALDFTMPVRPGGGALTFNVNGGWSLESYQTPVSAVCSPGASADPTSVCSVSKLGYNEIRFGAGAAWRFLPRTQALLDFGFFKRMPNDSAASNNVDPSGVRFDVGATGLVTPHVAATVKLGYGSTSGTTNKASTMLATLEGEWIPTETASVKASYERSLAVDPGTQYLSNRIAVSGRQLMAGRYTLGLTLSWDGLDYVDVSGSTSIVQLSPSVGVDVTRWLKAELAYAFTNRSVSGTGSGSDYTKNEAWLKVVGTY